MVPLSSLQSPTCDTLLSPAVHTRLLRIVHGHPPHAPLWLEPCLRSGPVPLPPASHLHTGPDPSPHGSAGPPGPLRALRGEATQADPPRLGEEPPHPLHPAGGQLPQRAGGCQSRVKNTLLEVRSRALHVGTNDSKPRSTTLVQ